MVPSDAHIAAQTAAILAVADEDLATRLAAWRERQTATVLDDPAGAADLAPGGQLPVTVTRPTIPGWMVHS